MNGIARLAAFALLLSCGLGAAHAQCINLSAVDTANTQNFDALANSGTTNTLSLAGWSMTGTGSVCDSLSWRLQNRPRLAEKSPSGTSLR